MEIRKCIIIAYMVKDVWALLQENLIVLHANKKGADQTLYLHSLICDFVILFLEQMIDKHATCKILILELVSVAEQDCLNLTLWLAQKI